MILPHCRWAAADSGRDDGRAAGDAAETAGYQERGSCRLF